MTFLLTLPAGNENSECKSNPIHNHYICIYQALAFLANSTPPNKHYFKVKLEFKSRGHVSNS